MRTTIAFLVGLTVALVCVHVPPRPARAAPSPHMADVVARVDGSIAHVTTRLKDEGTRRSKDDGVGAGFLVESGLVVTSRHVVSGARQVVVTFPGAAPQLAKVVGVDDATDTALLRVSSGARSALTPRNVGTVRKGQRVYAVGSPYHLANSWSEGIVSGLQRSGVGVNPRGYESYIQTDAAANLGNSGGPLLDAEGRVIGVMSAILSRTGGSAGIGLAVPIDAVLQAVARLQGKRPPRPSLGLSVRPHTHGLMITRVDADSPAARAGVRPGEVIVRCNDQPVASAAELQRAAWRLAPGTPLRLTLRAGTHIRTVSVSLP